jgi:hypothetical protein
VSVENKRVLIISDQHFPYNHADIIAFLRAINKKYKPDRVINIGDEVDYHALSFHDSDPDLLSAGDELQTAINRLKPLYKIFPQVDVMESNHGSMVYRKAKHHGIPAKALKTYRDTLEAPKGWKWHKDLTIKLSDGSYCYFCHTKGGDIQRVSQSLGMSVVAGHMHERFEIRYWANSLGLYFGMHVGCLIEDDSLAFAYNKLNLKRPLIGVGIIIDGLPRLLPMVLNKQGRWIGKVP